MRYRTKPCEIEAVQWTGDNLLQIFAFGDDSIFIKNNDIYIHTLEGDMKANINDYIIKGLRGEFYPCKPDVFIKKYEEIEE